MIKKSFVHDFLLTYSQYQTLKKYHFYPYNNIGYNGFKKPFFTTALVIQCHRSKTYPGALVANPRSALSFKSNFAHSSATFKNSCLSEKSNKNKLSPLWPP